MKILLPKDIDSFEKLIEFLEPTDFGWAEVRTKKKGLYCFGFSQNPNGKIDYLIDDGISTGSCKLENFNRYLDIFQYGELRNK